MVLVGFTWFFNTFNAANDPWVFTLSLLVSNIFLALFVHLLVAYPTGRLSTQVRADGRRRGLRRRGPRVRSRAAVRGRPERGLHELPQEHARDLGKPHGRRGPERRRSTWSASRSWCRRSGSWCVRRRAATAAARRILDPVLVSGAITLVVPRSRVRARTRLEGGEHASPSSPASSRSSRCPASSSRACSGSGSRAPPRASCCRRSPRRRRSRRPRTVCAGRCTTPPSSSRGGCRRAAGTSTRRGIRSRPPRRPAVRPPPSSTRASRSRWWSTTPRCSTSPSC